MTTKIVVAAAMCTPARVYVTAALQPYGVQYTFGGQFWGDYAGAFVRSMEGAYLGVCEVFVRDQAAKWAEYLLLRSGKLQLVGKPLDERNAQWALQWHGAMPRPWVEAGCNVKALATPTATAAMEIPKSRKEHRPAVRRRERKGRY
jgi:hypothetical protein